MNLTTFTNASFKIGMIVILFYVFIGMIRATKENRAIIEQNKEINLGSREIIIQNNKLLHILIDKESFKVDPSTVSGSE